MSKRIISILLCLIMVVLPLASCTKTVNDEQNKNDAVLTDKVLTENTEITVNDQAGRKITLQKPAEKIVSVYYISTAILTSLGLKDNMVGIEKKAEERTLYTLCAPEYLNLPAVGSGKGINIESIAELNPDIVILPKKLSDSAEMLEEIGITAVIVDPETQEKFVECVELLAALCGKTEKAQELINYYNTKLDKMAELTKDLEKPTVYFSSASSYFSTCTENMYQTRLIENAGGKCVSAELASSYWETVSPETLNMWNPEYIFCVVDAEYSLEDIYNDPALSGVSAVKNNKVFSFPSKIEAWDYPTPSSVLGVMYLTSILHPEEYTKEDFIKEATEFYKTFFGIDVTPELIGF